MSFVVKCLLSVYSKAFISNDSQLFLMIGLPLIIIVLNCCTGDLICGIYT